MKTSKKIITAAVTLTILLVSASPAFAQSLPTGELYGGNGVEINADLDEYMITVIAEVLGMNVEDVAAQYEAGSTFATIALAQGVLPEDVNDLLQTVRSKALEMAVADGAISETEAAWLESVQFGGNARGGQNGMSLNMGVHQYSTTPLYLNHYSRMGASMGRGGRR
jgi:hypothetical protein